MRGHIFLDGGRKNVGEDCPGDAEETKLGEVSRGVSVVVAGLRIDAHKRTGDDSVEEFVVDLDVSASLGRRRESQRKIVGRVLRSAMSAEHMRLKITRIALA